MMMRSKVVWVVVGLSLLVGWLSNAAISLVTADLGRHLVNGRMFWESGVIPNSNLFSYTYPEMPFINHHWLTGVVFYGVFWLGGFEALSWLFILVNAAAFGLLFNLIRKSTDIWWVAAVALGYMPLIISRSEIRPEVFSYLLISVFIVGLYQYYHQRLAAKWLWGLVLLELLWVNLHIYFIIGIGLIGLFLVAFLLAGVTKQRQWSEIWLSVKSLGLVLAGAALVTLVNPNGLSNAIRPFQIYGNYGYRVLEEQSVHFLQQVFPVPVLSYFYLGLVVLVASWIWVGWRVYRRRQILPWPELLLTVVFVVFGWIMLRNFSLFGLVGMTVVGLNLASLSSKNWSKERLWGIRGGLLIGVSMIVLMLNSTFWQSRPAGGVGLEPGVDASAKFFRQNKLTGPIFNNYDIGGYLIYYLYPQERVFVDNRPEVYPASFFQQTYIPMQENDQKWQKIDAQYRFNTIFFYRLDLTPWAQHFLVERVKDPVWAPVFVDGRTIILVRRNEQNQSIIEQFELPAEIFKPR